MKSLRAILSAAILSTVVLAKAGTELGNGMDNYPLHAGAAWFLGEKRTIQACVNLDKNFGMAKAEVIKDIENAFQMWVDYINFRRIDLISINGMYPYAKKLTLNPNCAGNEDLVFELGTRSKIINEARSKLENPTAFSYRTMFDMKEAWSLGLIWVIENYGIDANKNFPDWAKTYHFKSVILHELGHIFGVPHVPGTIMAQDLSKQLSNGSSGLGPSFIPNQIDGTRYLVFSSILPESAFGHVGFFTHSGDIHFDSEHVVFESLTGRRPKGSVWGKVSYNSLVDGITFEVMDDVGTKSILIKTNFGDWNNPQFAITENIFKRSQDNAISSQHSFGYILFGTSSDPALLNSQLVIEINNSKYFSDGPIFIKQMTADGMRTLFRGGVRLQIAN
jgi:hypothetical protein